MTDQPTHRHTEDKVDETHFAHHIVPPSVYIVVVLILFLLTWFTVWIAYKDAGGLWNLVIALGVATIKAVIVAMWFMHVRYGGRLIQITIFTTLMFFMLLLFGTLADYYTRNNIDHAGYTGSTPEPSFVERDDAGVKPGGEAAISH